MYLIFDTETTGFPRKNVGLDHPSQPHIVQLAMLLVDEEFNEINSLSTLIKPNGWTIPEEAFNVHGISTEKCEKYGVEIDHALGMFHQLFDSNKAVAHNVNFDSQLIDIESVRASGFKMRDWKNSFCTMEAMTPICKLPAKFRGSLYKWPKLQEAHAFCFGHEFDKAHDALADVRATARVLKWYMEFERDLQSIQPATV